MLLCTEQNVLQQQAACAERASDCEGNTCPLFIDVFRAHICLFAAL